MHKDIHVFSFKTLESDDFFGYLSINASSGGHGIYLEFGVMNS